MIDIEPPCLWYLDHFEYKTYYKDKFYSPLKYLNFKCFVEIKRKFKMYGQLLAKCGRNVLLCIFLQLAELFNANT